MKTIILWALLVSLTSILVSHAETTTSANLLNNNTFDENTDGWTLSDSNVKRDANSYNDAGNSPTIRFKGQTSTITQSVDTSGLETNKEITGVTVKYHGYGCGNSPGGWCNDEAHDTIVTNITLKNETGTEVSTNTTAVPYEDGWTHHTITKSINDTFLTGETGITFSLQGIDTGDSSNWLGPITDNYELLVTYQDYVAPVVEPVVIEPVVIEPVVIEPVVIEPVVIEPVVIEPVVIEPIVVIEPTVIGAIDLSTEVTLDLIQDVQMMPEIQGIELTPEVNNMDMNMDINMNMTNIEMPADVNLQSQPIEIEIPQQIDMTVEIRVAPVIPTDIPDLANLAPIDEVQEIQEMPVIEIPVSADLEVEMEMDSVEIEQPEELNNSTMEEDLVEMNDEIIENVDEMVEEVAENKENNNEAKETETNDGGDEKSELSESSESETKESAESKVVKKSESKDSKKSKKDDVKKSTVKKEKSKPKTKTVVQKPKTESSPDVLSVDSLGHMVLPAAYLQVLQDTIKIVETVSITQDMIYEQNTYDLVQSSFESSFGGDSADRFDSLLGVQSRYQSPTYRSSGR
jgi:hypothetical protein